MRKLVLTALALGSVLSVPAAAQQRMWQPEIGIKAGFVHANFPATDASASMIDIPGVGGIVASGGAFAMPAPLYGIIPIGEKMAIEPSFGFQNINDPRTIGSLTTFSLGARFNYALNKDFYVGAGPTMYLVKASGLEDTQGAFQVAAGYHRPLGSSFSVLAEAFYEKRENSEVLQEADLYGLRIGAGTKLGGSHSAASASHSNSLWTPSIGIQGGWSLVSGSGAGGNDVTIFSLPFVSQSIAGGFAVYPGPSALYLILPVGQKLAVEPSVDFHNFKPEGADAVSTYEFGAKLNYAFNRKLYAGVGAEYTAISATGIDDGSSMSIVLATGLRFPLSGALQGRTELNYRMFDGTDIFGGGQTTSFVFGIMVPVK